MTTVNELMYILGGNNKYRIEPLEKFIILAQGIVDDYYEEKSLIREKYGNEEIFTVTIDNGIIVIVLAE